MEEEGDAGAGATKPPQLASWPILTHIASLAKLLSLIVYASNANIPRHHASVLYIGVVFVYRYRQ